MYGNMMYPVDRITENSISVRTGNQSLRTGRPHEFEPVALTPDILIACGFEKSPEYDPEFTYIHPELNILFDGESFWFKENNVTHYLGKCESLHKLQNGILNILNRELTVNLEKVKA